MNVYQKVLVKLCDAADSRETKAVYLKDIVKDLGFYPSYSDIFTQMSRDGWITETKRSDEVNITPWGIREAKKLMEGDLIDPREVHRGAKKVQAAIKDLSVMAEELVADTNEKNLDSVRNQIETIETKINDLSKLIN